MKLQLIAAVAALAAGAANAALNDFNTGNSSVAFVAYDATGAARSSVFVDLGFDYSDFNPLIGGSLAGNNQEVVWNFANNTITRNGQLVSATNDFSAFASFLGGADAADVRWSVIGGSNVPATNFGVLTTGTPTLSQRNQQDSTFTSSAGGVGQQTYWAMNNLLAGSADNESYYAPNSTDEGYTATGQMYGLGNYVTNVRFAGATANAKNNFWLLDVDSGDEFAIGEEADDATNLDRLLNGKGTFILDREGQTLTWVTAAVVPEPGTYALMVAGLAVMGLVARRRRAE